MMKQKDKKNKLQIMKENKNLVGEDKNENAKSQESLKTAHKSCVWDLRVNVYYSL